MPCEHELIGSVRLIDDPRKLYRFQGLRSYAKYWTSAHTAKIRSIIQAFSLRPIGFRDIQMDRDVIFRGLADARDERYKIEAGSLASFRPSISRIASKNYQIRCV